MRYFFTLQICLTVVSWYELILSLFLDGDTLRWMFHVILSTTVMLKFNFVFEELMSKWKK